MARPRSKQPTELELAILKILWREGPLPVRRVRECLGESAPPRELAHTTVVTTLNTMVSKKYLGRRAEGTAYVFRAAVKERDISGKILRDVLKRVFDGSSVALVNSLLETEEVSDEEHRALRQLLRDPDTDERDQGDDHD